MIEWLVAIASLLLFLAVLPRILRRPKPARRKAGGSGVMVGIGLAFAMVFDPKAAQAIEVIDEKREGAEDAESADKP